MTTPSFSEKCKNVSSFVSLEFSFSAYALKSYILCHVLFVSSFVILSCVIARRKGLAQKVDLFTLPPPGGPSIGGVGFESRRGA